MTTPNPFVFQGLPTGAPGNPLLQSLDMMRQAWSSLTPGAGLPTSMTSPIPLDPAEIDRRITELQAVENWLTLNLTMLQGSIRALEVQRATIATLRSFANLGGHTGATGTDRTSDSPSPLEVALGLKPAPGSESRRSDREGGASSGTHSGNTASTAAGATAPEAPATPEGADSTATGLPPMFTDPGQAAAAQQAWWNMLQQQFQQIAGAAAATFPAAAPAPEPSDKAAPAAAPSATPRKAATTARKATKAVKRARKAPASR